MMRLGLTAVTLASLSSVAAAGTYLGVGIGSESSGGWERTDGGASAAGSMDGYDRSGRLMLGTRFGKLSVEGQASRFDVDLNAVSTDATQVAAALKLSIPLGNNFEFFGKGGLERTWLTSSMADASGNGLLLGAGFEYRLNLGVTAASIFVDYQRASTAFTDEASMAEWDGVTSMWTLGATVSL